MTSIGVSFLIFSLVLPAQFVFAENIFLDFFEDVIEVITDEDRIRQALLISEELALKIAHELGYDFSKSYFENYKDAASKDLTFEHILLSVIQSYNLHQYSNILTDNSFLRQFEINEISQEIEKSKDEFRTKFQFFGTYDKDAYDILESNLQRLIIAKYTDQSNVDALYQTRSVNEELAIMLIQATPSYDPKTGQLVTLNHTMNEFVQDIPALEGTDIKRDPLRSGVLLVTEPDYTMNAKLIKTKDGHVISFEEAIMYDYKNEDVRKAQLALEALDFAMDVKKIEHPEKKAQQFRELMKKINEEKENLLD